jgi:spore coat protein A, manganese oxidase
VKLSRREFLQATGKTATAQAFGILGPMGCAIGRPRPVLVRSRVSPPSKFQSMLPLLPVVKPVREDGKSQYFDLRVKVSTVDILKGLKTKIWGYDGLFPGPTIEARTGIRTVLTLHNDLRVPIVNHLHGGHTPAESDGYPTDLILPVGQWDASQMPDPLAHLTRGSRDYIYPNHQRAATLWYHDHRMDFTGPQMWRGLAGFYLLRDEEEDKLPLPKGDKEIALLICDRSFDSDGSFLYPSRDASLRGVPGVDHPYMGGVLGDVILVNGLPWPRIEVANVRYRLRILNASNARRYELELHPKTEGGRFTQIGSDGGLLSAPLVHRTIPIAPAERFDIIIDFSAYPIGSKVVLKNKLTDDATQEIMRFDVVRREKDDSSIPAVLSEVRFPDASAVVTTRKFDFRYAGMSRGWVINGKPFDPARMDAQPKLNSTEIWQFRTDIHHPLHLHLAQFQVLGHSGRVRGVDTGWKDTLDLSAGETANILVRFADYPGRYVFHCHNLEHEDMAMMGNFEVI